MEKVLGELNQKVGESEKMKTAFINCIYNQLLLNNLQVISQKYGRNL